VTTKYLNGLIELIHSNLQTNQESSAIENPKRHFQRTLDYISSREYEGVVTEAKWVDGWVDLLIATMGWQAFWRRRLLW